jgi:tripartite-type tricarboxylate transporter receptor subunit TctC
MKLPRRRFLHLAACAAALPAVSRVAMAQTYPSRTIKIIVPFPPGGPSDFIARLFADKLSGALGQTVIVENRAGGAGGSIGVKAAATADPDGYTLLLCPVSVLTQSPLVYRSADYDPIRSFAPIALLLTSPLVIVVNPTVPAKTLAELAAYAKANPGKVSFASPGFGTTPHLMGELFRLLAGAEMTHVPYRGSAPAINDLLAAQVQMYIDAALTLLPQIEAGKLRPLGVAGETRSVHLPGVPTTAEGGFPRLQGSFPAGLFAPPGTPASIIDRLNAAANNALKSADVAASLNKLGAEAKGGSTRDFAAFIAADAAMAADLVAAAGIKPE